MGDVAEVVRRLWLRVPERTKPLCQYRIDWSGFATNRSPHRDRPGETGMKHGAHLRHATRVLGGNVLLFESIG